MASGDDTKWQLSCGEVVQYRQHVQARIQEDVRDSLLHLDEHHKELQALMQKLTLAKEQVVDSVARGRELVQQECSTLRQLLTAVVADREAALLLQLQQIEESSMPPLRGCESVLNMALQQTQQLRQYGRELAGGGSSQGPGVADGTVGGGAGQGAEAAPALGSLDYAATKTPFVVTRDRITQFQKEAALNNDLPSVPELCTIPCVSVVFPATTSHCLTQLLRTHGTVRRMGPVQVTDVEEKPGAVLVYWEETEDDDDDDNGSSGTGDGQKVFVLQCSLPDQHDAAQATYSTVYRGPEYRFLLQKLVPGLHYWLRVTYTTTTDAPVEAPPQGGGTRRGSTVRRDSSTSYESSARRESDGSNRRGSRLASDGTRTSRPSSTTGTAETALQECVGAWSLPRQCITSVPHYRWQADGPWRVADDGRLASKDGDGCTVVSSCTPQLTPDCTLTLQVVSGGVGCSDEGVAVSWAPLTAPQQLLQPGALFVGAAGGVVVDGAQRLMKLPPLRQGSVVSFVVEHTRRDRLRVHVDTEGKMVSYEWTIPAFAGGAPRLYFSACFADPVWALRVY